MFIVDHLGKGSSYPLEYATQSREQKSTKRNINFVKRQQNKNFTRNSESIFLENGGSEFWLGFLK